MPFVSIRGRQRETEWWKEKEAVATSCLLHVPAGIAQLWHFILAFPQGQWIPVCSFPNLCRHPLVRDLNLSSEILRHQHQPNSPSGS